MSDVVSLKVGGDRYEGWKEVSIETGLDNLSGAFNLALTERFPDQPEKWVIKDGAACEVWIGDDLVSTGYVDEGSNSIGSDSHPVEVSGRDKTGDLVDASAIHTPGTWSNRKLEQIAADLAAPFGVTVKAVTDTGEPFAKFALQQGETVFEAIERMCRMRAVLPTTSPAGVLELRRPGQAQAGYQLRLGENLKSIRHRRSQRDRFSSYILKGQASGDDVEGAAARPRAEAKDPDVTRYRPLVIVNSEQTTQANLADRAKWEATVRAGRSREVTAVVQGWRAPDGSLYRADVLVQVVADQVGVNEILLVTAVRFTAGERGKLAELTLAPKEAFSLLAIPESEAGQ